MLRVDDGELEIGAVCVGPIPMRCWVNNISKAEVEHLGPLIEAHPDFPQHVNAGFMRMVPDTEIKLRVYERGISRSSAYDTGVCARSSVRHFPRAGSANP